MPRVIWETFKSIVLLPLVMALWLILGLLLLVSLQARDIPFVKAYFGILVIVVLSAPFVVLYFAHARR
jgi:pilus assembly protein TadC